MQILSEKSNPPSSHEAADVLTALDLLDLAHAGSEALLTLDVESAGTLGLAMAGTDILSAWWTEFQLLQSNTDYQTLATKATNAVHAVGLMINDLANDPTIGLKEFDEEVKNFAGVRDALENNINNSLNHYEAVKQHLQSLDGPTQTLQWSQNQSIVDGYNGSDTHILLVPGDAASLGIVGVGDNVNQAHALSLSNGLTSTVVLQGMEGVSLLSKNQIVTVAPDATGTLVVDGSHSPGSQVEFGGTYGSYEVIPVGNYGVIVENSTVQTLVEHASRILFDNRSISFNSNGDPIVSAVGTNPPGHAYVIAQGNSTLGGFNQLPFYDPLQGDKIEFVGGSVLPNATNFVAAPDLASTYADAVTLANTLLQQFRYVAVTYNQGTPDSNSPLQDGQNFLLIFADLNGDHTADTVLRLVGLDNASEISTKDFALVKPVVNSVSSSPNTGLHLLNEKIAITLTMNEGVTVIGSPALKLNDGGTATYDAAHSDLASGKLVFNYIVAPGQSTGDLKITSVTLPTGSSVKDTAGVTVDFTKAVNADLQISIDGIAPNVKESLANDTGVSKVDKITMDAGLVGSGDANATVTFTANRTTPSAPLRPMARASGQCRGRASASATASTPSPPVKRMPTATPAQPR